MRSAALSPTWFRVVRREQSADRDAGVSRAEAPRQQPLLPRVADDVPGAVEACVDRYGGAIWNLVRRACTNHAEAEDACQDIFVDLWRHAARFDASLASEWTFVMTVARRRLIDRFRRQSRRIRPGAAGEQVLAGIDAEDVGPDESAIVSEDAKLARAAMVDLSDSQRRVIDMSIFGGMSYPEIADELGLPLGTVKTHARRGLLKLRSLLSKEN